MVVGEAGIQNEFMPQHALIFISFRARVFANKFAQRELCTISFFDLPQTHFFPRIIKCQISRCTTASHKLCAIRENKMHKIEWYRRRWGDKLVVTVLAASLAWPHALFMQHVGCGPIRYSRRIENNNNFAFMAQTTYSANRWISFCAAPTRAHIAIAIFLCPLPPLLVSNDHNNMYPEAPRTHAE